MSRRNLNLHISAVVRGRRTNANNRVEYLVSPNADHENEYAIPEKVVLTRWRKRRQDNRSFGGMRLSPNIWHSLRLALGEDDGIITQLSETEIDRKFQEAKPQLKRANYPCISGHNVVRLVAALKQEKFSALMARHNDALRANIYGTPDLFLWAVQKRNKKISHFLFVEVKKPKEPLSIDQKNELLFLNEELKVKAVCFRLKEVD